MKEHFQDYGIRKWAGNDLIELQSEPLEALQKLVEPYAPCILQGCKTTGNEDGSITVEAGLVALQGKDFKGEDCVKIVRFAGVADTKPPIYITLECEPESRVYGDSQSKAIAYNYKAVATTQEPKKPYLEINVSGNKRLVDTLGITQKLDWEGGDASQTKVAFNNEGTDTEDLKSGNTLSKLFGGIKKWLDRKVDKIDGKGLSDENFTKEEKEKLEKIAKEANNYTLPAASLKELGGIRTDYPTKDKNYKVSVDSIGRAYVNVPWTDNNTTYGAATQSTAGLLSAADKKKLDGIAEGANNYSHPTTASNKHIPSGGSSGQYLKYKSSGEAQWATPTAAEIGAATSSHSHNAATQSAAGFMSAADKKKLDNIETSDKLIGYVNTNRNVYPGDTMTIGASGVTLAIGIATEKMCKVGARAYIYQANTSNCKFTIDNIDSVLASPAAKSQMTKSGNTLALNQSMGFWTITWFRSNHIWIDFDVLGGVIK